MTTDQKLEHARCMVNAARHYLNSAYADLQGEEIPQSVVYGIVGHVDKAQADLQGWFHANGGVTS